MVTDALVAHLRGEGHEVLVLAQDAPWPDVGDAVGREVGSGAVDRGVVCCWTGTDPGEEANVRRLPR